MTAYGVTSGTGTVISGSGSTNTLAYTQVSASCGAPLFGCSILCTANNNTAMSDARWLIDLGVGAAASEVSHVTSFMACDGNYDQTIPHVHGPFYGLNIPKA